jgi:hypothetical protein
MEFGPRALGNRWILEDPKAWMKFTAAMAVAVGALTVLLWKRRIVSRTVLTLAMLLASAALSICLDRPRWFRPVYRVGMTVSFHIGQVVGRIVRAVFFWLVLTPMGLLLRVWGKGPADDEKENYDHYLLAAGPDQRPV